MSSSNRIRLAFMAGAITALTAAGPATADDTEYERDVRPGLNVRDDSSGSLLSRAAREGVSVVISESGPLPQQTDVETYTVREGDTLWDICTKFFGDPYVWPRVWSYNTKITNPHWIYPGDVLWLVPQPKASPAVVQEVSETKVVKRSPQAILIRNRGFVDKEVLEHSGTVVGAQKEVQMLAQYDEAYVQFETPENVRVGDEFAAYEVIGGVDGVDDPDSEIGKLVEIKGVVRVTQWDEEDGIARVVIDESLKPIERGTRIGPVHRRFDLVPPVANDRELKGHVIAFIDPVILAAANQVLFVDRGTQDGVREGNRFFVIEKRDRWRASNEDPDAHDGFPFEVLAEMRVIEARPHTSTCLVTASVKELEIGAEVEMVKGY